MRRNIVLILLIFIIISCSKESKDFELEVYAHVFDSLENFKNYYKPAPPPSLLLGTLSGEKLKKEQKKYDSLLNEYNKRVASVNKYLFISNNLTNIDINDIIKRVQDKKKYEFINKNPSLYNKNRTLPIEVFQDNLNIKLLPISNVSDSILNTLGLHDDVFYIGYMTLSNVVFNEDFTKGVLVYSFYCGKVCGKQVLVLVVKENNIWKINEKIVMKIS